MKHKYHWPMFNFVYVLQRYLYIHAFWFCFPPPSFKKRQPSTLVQNTLHKIPCFTAWNRENTGGPIAAVVKHHTTWQNKSFFCLMRCALSLYCSMNFSIPNVRNTKSATPLIQITSFPAWHKDLFRQDECWHEKCMVTCHCCFWVV